MGKNTGIEWCDHTWNPWWGCVKVSPGCQHCYAETLSKRFGNNIWGPSKTTDRRLFGSKHWAEPLKWNAAAAKTGKRARVFCASMADVFEDHPMVKEARSDLFALIERTSHLDWLLLTKRPENVNRMIESGTGRHAHAWLANYPNVWIGTSVENQEQADKRISELLNISARVRFLSCEPLLGPVNLRSISIDEKTRADVVAGAYIYTGAISGSKHTSAARIQWVIVGGESGPGARPMHPDWARSLRNQCMYSNVPFHFKQWGHWLEFGSEGAPGSVFNVNSLPRYDFDDGTWMFGVGKHAAGRMLDGREWDEFPQVVR